MKIENTVIAGVLALVLGSACGDDGGTDDGSVDSSTMDSRVMGDGAAPDGSPPADARPDADGSTPPDGGPPPTGQIIVDPANPAWLRYADGGPFFLCGPGDPEDFLYRGTRNADGTRTGDQSDLISKLAPTGANGIYMQIIRSHGGDGAADHNPFVDSDPAMGLSDPILEQWEGWFDEMEAAGIVVYLFIYDDSARIWNTGDDVGAEERAFLTEIVDRFEHHPLLIWVVGEEYEERYSAARVSNIAAVIREADDGDHVIGVHKLGGIDFSELADDPNVDQFAIQYNMSTPDALHSAMVTAFGDALGRYNLNMSESASHGTGRTARLNSWASAMGGAYVMVLGQDIAGTAVSDLEDCGRMVQFMEAANLTNLEPHDELAMGATQYVLASPGSEYIAYASDASGDLGLRGLDTGSYELAWLDPADGDTAAETVDVTVTDATFTTPADIGPEVVLRARRVP